MMLWMPGASVPSFMGLSAMSVLIYLVQTTAATAIMTFLYLRTNGSVLIAVLAHLAFNTAESVVSGGLPDAPVEQLRAVYLVNVGVLAVLGLVCMAVPSSTTRGLGRRSPQPRPPSGGAQAERRP